MKLRVLVDNNTLIDQYYVGEPGLSYYIEEAGKSYLFDVGYSHIFLKNAFDMALPVADIDGVILSHGHNDHTRGLLFLHELYEKQHRRNVPIFAHPLAFARRRVGALSVGAPLTVHELTGVFAPQLERRPVWISDRLVYLGQIKRRNTFEGRRPAGEIEMDGRWQADYVLDDTALAYCSARGLVIITGCSHAGICNIIEQARQICGEETVAAVIGGFHLMNPEADVLARTAAYFKKLQPEAVYAAHCCDFASKKALAEVVLVREVGVNLSISWE